MKRTPIKRKTPLKRISKKGRIRLSELRDSFEIVKDRSGGRCENDKRLLRIPRYEEQFDKKLDSVRYMGFLPKRCENEAIHMHHIKPRSKGRDDSPENLMHLCFECHRWIHDNPEQARKLGVLK